MNVTQTKTLELRQLFDKESSTYTYLLFDPTSREGVLIDPVKEQVERDLGLIKELGITLKYVLETHVHADHITGAADLREATGADTAVGESNPVECANIFLKDGDALEVGGFEIQVLSTPGHTDGCLSFYTPGMVFTGDALFIRGTGRTDFQAGDAETLYHSIKDKLFTLADDTIVYPGHDYKGRTLLTIAEEKAHNPRVQTGITLAQFKEIMANLNLPMPAKIEVALPANLSCGNVPQG